MIQISLFLGCIECMRCRLLLPMCMVSVHQSVRHAGSFGAAFAKSLWPLVTTTNCRDELSVVEQDYSQPWNKVKHGGSSRRLSVIVNTRVCNTNIT